MKIAYSIVMVLVTGTVGAFWVFFLIWCMYYSKPRCQHLLKDKLNTGAIENTINVQFGKTDAPTTYLCNKFELYLCHDCGCVVWKESE
jgi:hypothetical protein